VTRPDQHDTRNQVAGAFELDERGRGDWSRVHVARMRYDQRLGPGIANRKRFARRVEELANHVAQSACVRWIESSRHCSCSDSRHSTNLDTHGNLSTRFDPTCNRSPGCASCL